MAPTSIVFAPFNPPPEIDPEIARYPAVVATGRSDYPNQNNNVLAFPGIFRGALDAGAGRITSSMKVAAAIASAELVAEGVTAEYIIPSPLDPRVAPAVTAAVAAAARKGPQDDAGWRFSTCPASGKQKTAPSELSFWPHPTKISGHLISRRKNHFDSRFPVLGVTHALRRRRKCYRRYNLTNR